MPQPAHAAPQEPGVHASAIYAQTWRRLFGVDSRRARVAVDSFAQLASSNAVRVAESFALWRALWRNASRPDFSALRADPLAKWRALTPCAILESRDPAEQTDLVFFLAQTYVAQTIIGVTERRFALAPSLAERLLVPSVFAWANVAREKIGVDAGALEELQLQRRAETNDPFAELYALFFAPALRRALGEFYTPPPLARFLYARATAIWRSTSPRSSFPRALDPTCGAGVFLTTALRALVAEGLAPSTALDYVGGFELSPLAAVAARANLLFAAFGAAVESERSAELDRFLRQRADRAPHSPPLPITLADALRDRPIESSSSHDAGQYDLLLGNPPWLAWEKLAPEYRAETKGYWRDYGLFTLKSQDARMGGGKKELAGLMVYATIDRRLKPGGVFSFVLPRALFQSGRSGDGFRRFGRGTPESRANDVEGSTRDRRAPSPFRALELDDFGSIPLFSYVSSKATALTGIKDAESQRAIVARRWRPSHAPAVGEDEYCDLSRALGASCEFGVARPASSEPGAPLRFFFRQSRAPSINSGDARRSRIDELASRIMSGARIESSGYVAKLGANAAGASGVFWVEVLDPLERESVRIRNLSQSGRRAVEQVESRVESALLFPLVRWRDVEEYRAHTPDTYLLTPQDPSLRRGYSESVMRERFPLALEYLSRFETPLRARAAYKRYQTRAPYWSLYNVDDSTFARYKVVWRRMDSTLRAAVLAQSDAAERPLVPQDLLSTTQVDSLQEADYLAALLNSTPMREKALAASVPGAKSFGSPGILAILRPKRFSLESRDDCELSELGAELRLASEQNSRQ